MKPEHTPEPWWQVVLLMSLASLLVATAVYYVSTEAAESQRARIRRAQFEEEWKEEVKPVTISPTSQINLRWFDATGKGQLITITNPSGVHYVVRLPAGFFDEVEVVTNK